MATLKKFLALLLSKHRRGRRILKIPSFSFYVGLETLKNSKLSSCIEAMGKGAGPLELFKC